MEVQFNPAQYTLTRQAEYFDAIPIGRAAQEGRRQFKKNNFYEFKTILYFDTYDTKQDVRKQVKKLTQFLEKDAQTHIPDELIFAWGEFAFIGNLININETYTMFHTDGNPVRAKVEIVIKGLVADGENSNKQPQEEVDATKVRDLIGTDELWMMAQKEYKDPQKWREIAKANNILNPRKHSTTRKLHLPSEVEK